MVFSGDLPATCDLYSCMQVSVIVMITKLVENNKRKANQYWPESSGEEHSQQKLDVGGGCKVEHLSTSFQGTYFLRQATYFENPLPGSFCCICLTANRERLSSCTPRSGRILVLQKNQGEKNSSSLNICIRVLLDLVHRAYSLQNCPNKERPGRETKLFTLVLLHFPQAPSWCIAAPE